MERRDRSALRGRVRVGRRHGRVARNPRTCPELFSPDGASFASPGQRPGKQAEKTKPCQGGTRSAVKRPTVCSALAAGPMQSVWVERATGPFCRATRPTAGRTESPPKCLLTRRTRSGGKLPPRTAKLAVPPRPTASFWFRACVLWRFRAHPPVRTHPKSGRGLPQSTPWRTLVALRHTRRHHRSRWFIPCRLPLRFAAGSR